MKFRPNILELLLIVAVIGILAGIYLPNPHHRLHPVKEEDLYGYWIAIPGAHEAFRLFLTNGGAGYLGSREIYTNLYRVTSWHTTNREIFVNLKNVTEPTWPPEYIHGKVGFGEIIAVRGGVNQSGEHWKRDILFYREKTVLQDLNAAAFVMTNQSLLGESNREADSIQTAPAQANQKPTARPVR